MQYLLNIMTMIPKKEKGQCRMIASMASGWRCDTKLDAKGERAWNAPVADEHDAARPGSCCLHMMEDRQILIDILQALGFDTLQDLWGCIKFYDSIDPQMLFTGLGNQEYGHTKTALTMLVHLAPCCSSWAMHTTAPQPPGDAASLLDADAPAVWLVA